MGENHEGNSKEIDEKNRSWLQVVEQPSTSKHVPLNPDEVSHNMNDLMILDCNSCDDVRQAIKQVLMTGKNTTDSCVNTLSTGCQVHGESTSQGNENQNDSPGNKGELRTTQNACLASTSSSGNPRPNKRGRPPKAGPSKKLRTPPVKSIYDGKLSNLVSLRRGAGHDSDTKSLIIRL